MSNNTNEETIDFDLGLIYYPTHFTKITDIYV